MRENSLRSWLESPRAVLWVVWLVSALYLAIQANQDWIAGDDGALGHSAERVLDGELPHRDFDAIYTGALSYLHAFAFWVFGIDLLATRITLLIVALAFVPAVYGVARRAASPWVAGLVTLSCVAWSIPNYFTAMASWYNLFFATFGILALMRYLETDRRRWLAVAGLCGGISVLFKSSGLGYVGAALLFLLYREQELTRQAPCRGRSWPFQATVGLGLLGLCAMLVALVSQRPTPMHALHFALPGLVLCGVLAANEWSLWGHAGGDRWRRLLRMGIPFGCGVLLPIALFAIPYASTSSLGDLYTGVFVLPSRRFAHIQLAMPPISSLWTAVPLALLLTAGFRRSPSSVRAGWAVAVASGLGVALWMGGSPVVYRATWDSVRPAIPLLALAVCGLLGWRAEKYVAKSRRAPLFLLAATAALSAPVQLPYPAGVYFCYVAPLVLLSLLHLVAAQPAAPMRLHTCLLVYYLFFAVLWNVPGATYHLGFRYRPLARSTDLDLSRARLHVSGEDAEVYRRLVVEVVRRSAPGSYIYAAPDIPEVYFLTGRRNPTRSLYDIFDVDYGKRGRTRRTLALLRERDVRVVVLRSPPAPSNMSRRLVSAIRARYPQRLEIAPFVVFWRSPAGGAAADR